MKNKLKSNKAITLIALIITVIVMLILVGVTVSVVINSNLLGTAQSAVEQTKAAYGKEAEYGDKITVDGKRYANIDDYLNNVEMTCDHEFGEEITIEENCEVKGKKYRVCKLCEYEEITEETPATGHNFVSGVCTKCSGHEITFTLTKVTKKEGPQAIATDGTATIKFEVSDEEYQLPTDAGVTVTGAKKDSWDKTTGTLIISNPTGAVTITIKAESIIGVYVYYDKDYTDVYQTNTPKIEFGAENGWRYLGKEAGTENIMLISTGIPVKLSIVWLTSQYWWGSGSRDVEQIANGLATPSKFETIDFGNGITGASFKSGDNVVGVRTLTLAELNTAVNKVLWKSRSVDDTSSGFKNLKGTTAVGLFDIQDIDIAVYEGQCKYWMATPQSGSGSGLRCVTFDYDGVDQAASTGSLVRGIRPVTLLSGVKLKAPTGEETYWTLEKINPEN